MKLKAYLDRLSETELDAYAARCGTTAGYIRCHLKTPRKTPRKALMDALADHSGGAVSRLEVLEHFYGEPEQAA